jgi:hypothetical protein
MNALLPILLVIFAILAGIRNANVGTDTLNYISFYESAKNGESGITRGLESQGDVRGLEPLFNLFNEIIAATGAPFQIYLIFISLIINFGLIGYCRREIGSFGALFLFCIWLMYPFYYSLSLNIIRQGLAFSIYFGMFVMPWKNKPKQVNWILILLPLIHISALIFIITHFISKYINFKNAITIWIIICFLSFLDSFSFFFNSVFSHIQFMDYYMLYMEKDIGYRVGFRLDFFSFSFFCIFLFATILKLMCINANMQQREWGWWLLSLFIINNSVGIAFSFLAYYDRFMSWSWSLVPAMAYWAYNNINLTKNTRLILLLFVFILGLINFSWHIFFGDLCFIKCL